MFQLANRVKYQLDATAGSKLDKTNQLRGHHRMDLSGFFTNSRMGLFAASELVKTTTLLEAFDSRLE